MTERQEEDENFRYLGGTFHYNGLGKEADRTSIRKMNVAHQLTGNNVRQKVDKPNEKSKVL